MNRRSTSWALLLLIAVMLAACGSTGSNASKPGKTTIGFLYVGAKNDFGYNQAAYQGSLAVKKAFPDAKVLEAENVPETAEAERVMEKMISDGATIIFPTSFGHLQPAMNVAKRHPNVTFLHQGGLKTAKNLGTYFGTIYDTQYAVGQAAGMATKSNKLGYVVAFPIAQTLLNVNAFERGAQSVNPKAKTSVVFTGNWCDPGKQAEAANSLLDQHVDVMAQHQDCTKTIVQTAERRGAMSTGYHVDASKFAPHGWLTGSEWNWGPLFVNMVKTVEAGKFHQSPYAGRYRAGIKEGLVQLAPYGAAATPAIRQKVQATEEALRSGKLAAFAGPVRDQSGKVQIPAGKTPDSYQLENTTYLVQGVVGQIPSG
ncbi:MAG: transporter substrate-binding protein [Conexibacter sp.]|jgi:basic membrane lipoprotein Med (substrate-binding protein (PBP1-ABC) superfamily)|nr:transporter substrate-binding protein [Conexibacter sp.]MCZ4495081.1 transporter substrate-binding protein [Conexibacter sp.]MDX6730587.1 basic rane protein [Baekduia sp.]